MTFLGKEVDLAQDQASKILREISQIIQSGNPIHMDARPSQEFQNHGLINKNKLDSYERSLQILQEQASLYVDASQIPVQLRLDIQALSSEVKRLQTLPIDPVSD